MEQAWFLQANPDLYDVDGALTRLQTILWRVPQHTGQIRVGDVTVLWRAGADAGVVGIGRVEAGPYVAPRPLEERPFVRSDTEESETTRVRIRVRAVPLIPKATVASLAEFAEHQILVAPRGTVFPINERQWAALGGLLPTPPDALEISSDRAAWPAPFAWEQRTRSVYPLPGGYGSYLDSLRAILTHISSVRPEKPNFGTWLAETLGTSAKAADLIRVFLTRTSLIQESQGFLNPTTEAQRWLTDGDQGYIVALLHSRVRFVGEMLALMDRPRTAEEIRLHANSNYGMAWSTRAQVDRRRGWLESASMVRSDDEGRLIQTELGAELVRRLTIAESLVDVGAELAREAEGVHEAQTVPVVEPDGLDRVLSRFRAAASNTADSTEFERVTAEVFRYLGFVAEHLGASGRTDVLVVAPLGPVDGYRIAVDCKTTSHEAVSDQQIDWLSLREHRARHQADYSAVVGPAFRASRVEQRAHGEGVALLDVETLAGLCAQHREIPLGLDVYRGLFDPSIEAPIESLASLAEEESRWLALAGEVVRVITELQVNEGPVVARDVYWNLERDADPWVTVQDIEKIFMGLASPAIGVLRETRGGFITLGSQYACMMRIRRLAELAGQPRPDSHRPI